MARAVIEQCLLAAGTAPSGANHQPRHFARVSSPAPKRQIREAAEAEERAYEGRGGERWLRDLEKRGLTLISPSWKPPPAHCSLAQPQSPDEAGGPRKNYYVKESAGPTRVF